MAILDQPLRVPILDGAVLFRIPMQNEFLLLQKQQEEVQAGEKTLDQIIDGVLGKVVGVENFFYADGTPVTPDDLRGRKFPWQFFVTLSEEYPKAVERMFRGEVEAAKKD